MTDPKALADEIKAAIFGSHSDPERGTTQEELLYLADQENYARHRYGDGASDLIRESMVKEYALRVTALRRMEAMREALLERVYAAARGLCHGTDWNHGTHAKTHGYRQKLIDAVAALSAQPAPPVTEPPNER